MPFEASLPSPQARSSAFTAATKWKGNWMGGEDAGQGKGWALSLCVIALLSALLVSLPSSLVFVVSSSSSQALTVGAPLVCPESPPLSTLSFPWYQVLPWAHSSPESSPELESPALSPESFQHLHLDLPSPSSPMVLLPCALFHFPESET